MARMLVKRPSGKVRLYCTTVGVWVTKLMKPEDMIAYLVHEHYEPHTEKEARDRVYRRSYDAEHLAWLHAEYDSQYYYLSRIDRERRRQG